MKEMLIFVVGFFWGFKITYAQTLPLQSFYRNNWQLVNPAAVDRVVYFHKSNQGIRGNSFAYGTRSQWINSNLDAPPFTSYFSSEFWPIKGHFSSRTRLGVQGFYHKFGEQSFTGLHFNYTFRLIFDGDKRSSLFISLNPGFQGMIVNRSNLNFVDDSDPIIDKPLTRFMFNYTSYGLFYTLRTNMFRNHNFYVGASIPPGMVRTELRKPLYKQLGLLPYYFTIGSYNNLGKKENPQKIDLEFTAFMRLLSQTKFPTVKDIIVNEPASIDLNSRLYIGNNLQEHKPIWIGFGLGTNGTYSFEFGHNVVNSYATNHGRIFRYGLGFSHSFSGIVQRPSFELSLFYANFKQVTL